MPCSIHPRSSFRNLALLFSMGWGTLALAQCDPSVPSFNVDLSYSPSATWMSPSIQRNGQCCSAVAPDICLQITLTLHPDAQGINFGICEGAVPPGALYYQIDCGPLIQVGQTICLDSPGPFVLTFCKPGNNTNRYCITSIPAPSAGPDITLNDGCPGTITSNGFTAGTVQWTSVGPGPTGAYNGYLGCPTCPTTTVLAQSGFPPYVDFQVCGLAISPCSQTTYCDTVRAYFNPALVAQILPEQPTICFGGTGTTITVNSSGGTPPYSYQWSTGETTASIFVGPGTYTVQVSDTSQCPPTSTTVEVISFSQPIQAHAGADIVVCTPATTVTLNGAVQGATGGQWITGAGIFQPSAQALNATYAPTAAEVADGFVDLVLATTGNGICPGGSDTVHISFSSSFLTAALTTTDATCNGTSSGSATFSPGDPSFTYQWSPSQQTTAMATGLAAGSYSVLVTDSHGCDTTMTGLIAEPAQVAIASLAVVDEQCAGNGDGSITATVTGGTPPYQYSWSSGQSTPVMLGGMGTYTLSVTDANGCTAAQGSATILALGQPNAAHAGSDLVACFTSLPVQLNGSVTNATGGTWSGGSGSFTGTGLQQSYMPSPAELLANGVDLLLTTTGNSTCDAAQDTVHVTFPTSFFGAAAGSSNVLCNGDQSGSASFSPDDPAFTFLWNDPAGQTGATATGLSPGNYTVLVTDQFGCDTTAAVTIAEPTVLGTAGITGASPSCAGGNNGTATVQPYGGTPAYTYQWSANAGEQTSATAIGLPPGAFTVVVTDANGCQTQATTVLTEPAPITLTAQVEDTVCVNSPVPLTAQASGGAGGHVITWAGIGTGDTLQYSFPATQVVHVSVVDQAGCTGPMVELPVTVLDLSLANLHTYGDTAFCPGGIATVGAWVSDFPGSVSLSWPQLPATGTGPFMIPAMTSRNLTVTATDICASTLHGNVSITVETPPEISLPPVIAEGCAPLTVHFPTGLTNLPVSYLWQFGDGSTSTSMSPVHVYQSGNHVVSLTVTTPLGCTADALTSGLVHAYPGPVAAFTATPWETDADHADVQFTDQSSGDVSNWNWAFGDGGSSSNPNPSYHFLEPGTWQVSLQVINDHGCTSNVEHAVQINPIYDVTVPNAFTPNPNGGSGGGFNPMDLSNDVFYPFIRFVKDFRMRVFNRWGELVFESADINRGWDGYYKGYLSQQDVYVYQLWVRFVDNKEIQRTGDLTLFR